MSQLESLKLRVQTDMAETVHSKTWGPFTDARNTVRTWIPRTPHKPAGPARQCVRAPRPQPHLRSPESDPRARVSP